MNINNEILILKNDIKKLEKKYSKLDDDITLKKKQLMNICNHSITFIKNDYISGSYYDRAEYIKITICELCNKEINREIKYGSFG
jgi:enoyl-[acyl-carrier-protein] reductase (NADH)